MLREGTVPKGKTMTEQIRPSYITALDVALDEASDSIDINDQAVAEFLDMHLEVIDEYTDILRRRADSYKSVTGTEGSIRQLGYPVLDEDGAEIGWEASRLAGRNYSKQRDEDQARARRDGEPVEDEVDEGEPGTE